MKKYPKNKKVTGFILNNQKQNIMTNNFDNKKRWFIFFTIIFVLIFLSVFGEIIVRIFRPQPVYSRLLEMTGEQYRPGGYIPFTLKPNYSALTPSMENPGKTVDIHTNSFGLRGKEINLNKPENTKRILILGDSYTFGVYVGDNETYPEVLEQLLTNEGYKVEVLNAGYADGWSPDEHYVWLNHEGLKFQPDIIIYGFFIGNDIDGIDPQNWVEINNQNLPNKIVNNSISVDQFGKIRSNKADSKTVGADFIYKIPIVRESHLVILLQNYLNAIITKITSSKVNSGWGDNPFPFILRNQNNEKMNQQENTFIQVVKGISDTAKNNNAEFITLMIPINFQVNPELMSKVIGTNKYNLQRNYFSELSNKFTENQINHVNLLDKMTAKSEKYYPDNGEVHFNKNGHLFTASVINDYIIGTGWLKKD